VESRSSLGRRLQSSFDPSIGEAFTGSEGGRANKGTEEADSDTRRIEAKTYMIGDHLRPSDRLRCVAPECWQWRLAACIIALAIVLALMCENVNAAPGGGIQPVDCENVDASGGQSGLRHCDQFAHMNQSVPIIPAVPTQRPFTLSHPLCATGFTLAQRFDTRDRFGIIVKREWKMTGCAKGRIVYGRKV
jgi:hypothetical protein